MRRILSKIDQRNASSGRDSFCGCFSQEKLLHACLSRSTRFRVCPRRSSACNLGVEVGKDIADLSTRVFEDIEDVASDVVTLGNQVGEFLANFPGTFVDFLEDTVLPGAFDLAGIPFPLEVAGALAALGIDPKKNIKDLPEFPEPPCLEVGTSTPFGLVGDDSTAANYMTYLWAFEKVLDLIPRTEASLNLRIAFESAAAPLQ